MPIYYLKIPLPKKYRSAITKIILDWAEGLPKFQKGYIHSLQQERLKEREEAQKHHERTRPPQGVELEFIGIRMMEVFNYEEFDFLRINLEKMFPNLKGFHSDQSFREYFQKQSYKLLGGGWINIGWIYRDRKPLGPQNCLHLPNLPPEVDYIEVGLHHILPSIIIIALDVRLKENFSHQLKNLLDKKYLPETKLMSVFLRDNFFGFSSWSSARSMERAIIERTGQLRKGIEIEVQPYICGGFSKWSSNAPKLPAIEIYGVKGLLNKRKNLTYLANKDSDWWYSLGFQLYYQVFHNKNLAFNWSRESVYTQMPTPHRILVFWENYLKYEKPTGSEVDERSTIFYTIREFLDNLLPPVAFIEIVKQKIEVVEKLRFPVYLNMKKGKSKKLKKQLALYGDLQQELIETERLLLELDQDRKYIEEKFSQSNPEKMAYLNLRPKSNKKRDENFQENVFSRMAYLRKIFEDQMNFLNKSYSTHIQFLNLGAVYRLQVISLFLSVVALVVALIASALGILGNWSGILILFNLLFPAK